MEVHSLLPASSSIIFICLLNEPFIYIYIYIDIFNFVEKK